MVSLLELQDEAYARVFNCFSAGVYTLVRCPPLYACTALVYPCYERRDLI